MKVRRLPLSQIKGFQDDPMRMGRFLRGTINGKMGPEPQDIPATRELLKTLIEAGRYSELAPQALAKLSAQAKPPEDLAAAHRTPPITPAKISALPPERILIGLTDGGEQKTYIIKEAETAHPGSIIPSGKVLGEGGVAQVFQANDAETGEPVAIKITTEVDSEQAILMQSDIRARIEAAAGQLKHPHIIPVYASGNTESHHPFLVMKFLPVPDLEQVLVANEAEGKTFGQQRAVNMQIQLMQAIAFIHSKGVFHADLKPSNVFLTINVAGEDHVIVTDFGLAKMFQNVSESLMGITRAGTIAGTPAFLPPEFTHFASNQKSLPPDLRSIWLQRIDVYALGVIFHQLLTNKTVFSFRADMKDFWNFAPVAGYERTPEGYEVTNRHGIDSSLWHIIDYMLKRNPTERYQKVSLALEHLQGIA